MSCICSMEIRLDILVSEVMQQGCTCSAAVHWVPLEELHPHEWGKDCRGAEGHVGIPV